MNTKLWNEVFTTDPKAVKPITGKQYHGNSPKPYWLIKRATEVFGPCGISWGVDVVNERFERLTETDVLHVALINVWYEYEGKKGNVQQMGQTKACYLANNGKMIIDEDAPKKSVTDGMVKCLSMIGFAGDIFSGRWDDSKYIQLAAKETEKRESKTITPTSGVMDNLSTDQQTSAMDDAALICSLWDSGDKIGAFGAYQELRSGDQEYLLGVWESLKKRSEVRSGLKKMHVEHQLQAGIVA